MPNICFHNLLITIKKDVALNLAHISKYCKNYFPITQITYEYGFAYVKSEAAIMNFFVEQLFWIFSEIL